MFLLFGFEKGAQQEKGQQGSLGTYLQHPQMLNQVPKGGIPTEPAATAEPIAILIPKSCYGVFKYHGGLIHCLKGSYRVHIGCKAMDPGL